MSRIGKSQLRFEDDRLLRGQGRYLDDTNNTDDLAMVFVRSSHASAAITDIDTNIARSMPGVVGIFGWKEMKANGVKGFQPRLNHEGPDDGAMRRPPFPPLADRRIRYSGEPILAVIASSRAAGELASEAVEITYNADQAVVTVTDALHDNAPRVWDNFPDNRCFHLEKGDQTKVRQVQLGADHVVKQQLKISRVTAAAIEPRAMRASFDRATNKYQLELGTQTPNRIRPDLAKVLNVDTEQIEVVTTDCGGSFGMKNNAFPEYAVGMWAAKKYGKTIRWRASRLESFLGDTHAREQLADVALALDKDGFFLALDVHLIANLGAYLGPATTHPVVGNIGGVIGVYNIPASYVRVEGVFTNTQNVAPYRGAGRPEATYVIERIIDIAASKLGIDKIDLRRRNMIRPDQMPFKTGLVFTYDSGDFPAVLDAALSAADSAGFDARKAVSLENGKLRGFGIANPIEIAGGPELTPHAEFASISIDPDGSIELLAGSSDTGQGHGTAFRQILHSRLGVDPSSITIVAGDTQRVPKGTGTFGSRTIAAAGNSIAHCANTLIQKMRPAAATALDVDPETLIFDDQHYRPIGSNKAISFSELITKNNSPVASEFFGSAKNATFPNGCHICEVEIDPSTGAVAVLSYLVIDDIGTVINPLLLKGQIAGGVAQGLGQALMEQIVYEPDTGQLLSASFMDYAMPRASDLTQISVINHEVPTESNLLGAKGAGEAGTVGALSAAMNAVCDALLSVGAGPIDMPATPLKVWSAIKKVERQAS